MSERKATLVLIHGAWAGSWVWAQLTPLLQAQGYAVLTPDMPGSPRHPAEPETVSLAGCVEHVLDCCAGTDGPIVLVGHSGGGAISTQAAERMAERVAGVIYIAGMMLPSGSSFAEVVAEVVKSEPAAAGIGPYLQWTADRSASWVPVEAIRKIFLQDLPDDLALAAAERFSLQPEGARTMVPVWTQEHFGRLPRLYVEALQDRSVVLATQRRMQALVPGAEVVSLDTGHVPQASAPERLAEVMAGFISRHASVA
ncbi:alpha/beta hydrolase [Pseudomonas sp. gcc21]|uniref:alpha/beta fold hydrolase n=1 Tax=Pseudomonas sp. gcc21 TaxID=2726989 RepID=UPI00145283B6|nr:alpha/beta fold hydrolase [Pseudomonas sp. gcc21]QJD57464.1 alpha/beta hydrolase [Pseudomonas sp. gcc21]